MLRNKIKRAATNNQAESDSQSDPKRILIKSSQASSTASPFFESIQFWQKVYDIECRMSAELKAISFLSSTISAVYNPIEYAANLHCAYLKKFLNKPKPILFIGMNPGPFGMVQTGVPFGHIPSVRDWMQLSGSVQKPDNELAARPVTGLLCDRSEQSGQRFWGLMQDICGDAEHFFRNCFVHNLCPLAFFHGSGRNLTPAELKTDKKKVLQEICAKYLKEAIDVIEPQLIISIGRYAEDRVKDLYKANEIDKRKIEHKCIPHPSPRALNNTNWNEKAKKWLIENDVIKFMNAP